MLGNIKRNSGWKKNLYDGLKIEKIKKISYSENKKKYFEKKWLRFTKKKKKSQQRRDKTYKRKIFLMIKAVLPRYR